MVQNMRKYDVIIVDFGDDVIGSEQGGVRPAVIVQNDTGNTYSPTTIVLPLTKQIMKYKNQPTHTIIKPNKENKLRNKSMVLGEAVRQISEKRILGKIGTVVGNRDRLEIRRVYYNSFGED